MLDPSIIESLNFFNPWWRGQNIDVPDFYRNLYYSIQRFLEKKQILAIVGLRRVGKTILLKQILKDIPNKKNCLYFTFDDFSNQKPEVLQEIINYFLQNLATDGKKWIFLDEIQKVPYWPDILKRFYDTLSDIKFLVSGSASLSIMKAKQTLAGRMYDMYLPPLTFYEFIKLHGVEIDSVELDVKKIQRFYETNLFQRTRIEALFMTYIQRGGFPEIVSETDQDIIRNYIKSAVVDHILQKDIPEVFGIRRPDVIRQLLEFCAKETTNLIELSTLSNALGVSLPTIKEYIQYLQDSFLIDLVFNYSGSIVHRFQKNKKVHIIHPSVGLAVLRYPFETLMVPELLGIWVETLCFQHAKNFDDRVDFWRTPQKEEVDLVLNGPPLLPIEVKYRNQIATSDQKSLKKFMELHSLSEGIIITKNQLDLIDENNRRIWMIPAWVFLLSKPGDRFKATRPI